MATLRKFIAGVVLLYAGVMLFFVGLMIVGTSNPFFESMTRSLIPLSWGAPLRASIFQLLGGLIGVTGFVLCIWPVKPAPLPRPAPPTIIIQKVPEPTTPTTHEDSTSVPKCKFCGSPLKTGDLFCPSCERSQA